MEEQISKNIHNSHLPPSSDRFVRQPKCLRKKSGKKAGGQPGHPGRSLLWSQSPDQVLLHPLASCPHCHCGLQTVPASGYERRQVVDVPAVLYWLLRLSVVDERKDSAGIPSDTSQILPSSHQTIYILRFAQNLTPARDSERSEE